MKTKTTWREIVYLACALGAFTSVYAADDLAAILSFEAGEEQGAPAGWVGGPPDTLMLDDTVRYKGIASGRISRIESSDKDFSSLTFRLPANVQGSALNLTAWVRSKGVEGYFGLWMRQDGRSSPVDFVNNYDLGLTGDVDWTQISVMAQLAEPAQMISFGLVLNGIGTVWIDNVQILVDGQPYSDAPTRVLRLLPWETDTEFDAGSGIADLDLTETQIEHVASLIEIWGFLKYHHPRIAAGDINIDYEFFRVMPNVLAADDVDALNRVLLAWIQSLGVLEPCSVCARAPENAYLNAPIEWIGDTDRWGNDLAVILRSIHANRPADGENVFIGQVAGVGNPEFTTEPSYATLSHVDAGFRLLALARLWNIIRYWFPYRDLIDTPWGDVLRTAIPRFSIAVDKNSYARELILVAAEIRDTHSNIWGSLDLRPPTGNCGLDVGLRFVDDKATVWELPSPNPTDLQLGDVLVQLDGRAVDRLVEEWRPYYAASNQPTRLRDMVWNLTNGPCEQMRLQVSRFVSGEERLFEVEATRQVRDYRRSAIYRRHDRAGETYQELSSDVAYLKLSSIESDDIDEYVERAQGKKGLVIDIRNYPNEFVVFSLGQRLISSPTPFARFTNADLSNPGAFAWTQELSLSPVSPTFDGRVAILVDETSQSQAEYTAMALRASPNSAVVGSTTAGADGNLSGFALPGGLRMMISGIGVFYPDKTPTQRIGIVPDIEAKPTIEGVRDGRDEVLEAALRYVLDDDASETEVRAMAVRP